MDEYVSCYEHGLLLIHRDKENLTEKEQKKQGQHEDELAKTRIYERNNTSSIALTDDSTKL